jgi:Fe2+ or Zn2+ uptake regulation protein
LSGQQPYRMTRQRGVILEELRKLKTHPSADEIYAIVREQIPRISLGTVYRNLEILAGLKEIKKLDLGGKLKRFDGNPEEHYHICCKHCDRIDDMMIPQLDDLENKIDNETAFKIIGHQLKFIGICPNCVFKAEKMT